MVKLLIQSSAKFKKGRDSDPFAVVRSLNDSCNVM